MLHHLPHHAQAKVGNLAAHAQEVRATSSPGVVHCHACAVAVALVQAEVHHAMQAFLEVAVPLEVEATLPHVGHPILEEESLEVAAHPTWVEVRCSALAVVPGQEEQQRHLPVTCEIPHPFVGAFYAHGGLVIGFFFLDVAPLCPKKPHAWT